MAFAILIGLALLATCHGATSTFELIPLRPNPNYKPPGDTPCGPGYFRPLSVSGSYDPYTECKDDNECGDDEICSKDFPNARSLLECYNTEGSYYCETARFSDYDPAYNITSPSASHFTVDEYIGDTRISREYRFRCDKGYYEYCPISQSCFAAYLNEAVTVKKVHQIGGGGLLYKYLATRLPTCKAFDRLSCAGVSFAYSATPVKFIEADYACRNAGMKLVNEAFIKVLFTTSAQRCITQKGLSSWATDTSVVTFTSTASPHNWPTRDVASDSRNGFLCVPNDFEYTVNRADIQLEKDVLEIHTCDGGQVLYHVGNGDKSGRNWTQFQDACHERALEVPGPRLKDCMRKLMLLLHKSNIDKCEEKKDVRERALCLIPEIVQWQQRDLAWIGFSDASRSDTFLATDGRAYPLSTVMPITICAAIP
ncbi:uncharacterized protein LOC135828506 [Sycon ciliatum]|uniref:uncharacterized protein LOC135828506 n=1 Tax=Sycon ciliatum TaxID=27933 RepID=UPI0031F5F9BF